MVHELRDQQRFDAVAREVAPESSDVGHLLLDRRLRIRGVYTAYERISLRSRRELVGEFVFDAFPDDPSDAQASGVSRLASSMETAMSRRHRHAMPLLRYDVPDPYAPGTFLPKVWSVTNTSVHDGGRAAGRGAEIQ